MKLTTYLNDPFYAKLREGRKARGLSQKQLAERSGLSLRTVQKLEAGMQPPALESLRKLSDGLECSADFLIGRAEWTDAKFVGKKAQPVSRFGT